MKKILIANRGEIACRVMRTCKRLGIATAGIYAENDAGSLHACMADEAHVVPGYLDIPAIIAVAKKCGAEGVHPGYGFLSENANFAEAVAQAGLTFIGPPPSAIRAMGGKAEAKALMEKAGVPLTPGYHGENQDAAFLLAQAEKIGYPVLIKASAGGGGKGMRVVERAADFADALAGAQREAKSSFGNEKVLIEKYLKRPRHVEIQVFADIHGNTVYLFERDCSVQRRHQKVLEEAPAPGLSEKIRKRMGKAAVAAAKSVGYVGAGTVEFLLDGENFYFMEMNTRLQVEHPVTEEITGLDLVEWQIRVARGEKLPKGQWRIKMCGHAIEARLYAEDPAKNFLPAAGKIEQLIFGNARIETGVRTGDTISIHYDPMIAKIIVRGKTRAEALRNMAAALDDTRVGGLRTNLSFLRAVVKHPAFAAGDLSTSFIAENHAALFAAPVSNDIWSDPSSWRIGGVKHPGREYAFATHVEEEVSGKLSSPMPGKVVAVRVSIGDKVKKGQPLIVVEAMKMEHTINAPADGTVAALHAKPGDQVDERKELVALS